MTLLALLLGLVYPACARPGVEGLPAPRLIEPTAIVRPRSPNTALAAPVGFRPAPDVTSPSWHMAPAALFRAVREVAAQQPRTTLQAAYDGKLQAQYVVRSAILNFPDLVMVQAVPAGTGAGIVIWSRSVYGWGDLGVNRKRVVAWLAALAAAPAVAQAGIEARGDAGGRGGASPLTGGEAAGSPASDVAGGADGVGASSPVAPDGEARR